jgi:hypothetical protein
MVSKNSEPKFSCLSPFNWWAAEAAHVFMFAIWTKYIFNGLKLSWSMENERMKILLKINTAQNRKQNV